jgi:hypothetical protein
MPTLFLATFEELGLRRLNVCQEVIAMRNSMKFRNYAQECRRLAKQMKPEHRATLLEIADAWDRCADEAAHGAKHARYDEETGGETADPDGSVSRRRVPKGTLEGAGRPPPRPNGGVFNIAAMRNPDQMSGRRARYTRALLSGNSHEPGRKSPLVYRNAFRGRAIA